MFSQATDRQQDAEQSNKKQRIQYPPDYSVPTPVGLNAIHPLSKEIRRLAVELIQNEEVLALFHEPLFHRTLKPQGVPDELWGLMTDEHKELVSFKVVSRALRQAV